MHCVVFSTLANNKCSFSLQRKTPTSENQKYAINHRVISRILLPLLVIIKRYGSTQKPTPDIINGHRVSKVNDSDSFSSDGVNLKHCHRAEMQIL